MIDITGLGLSMTFDGVDLSQFGMICQSVPGRQQMPSAIIDRQDIPHGFGSVSHGRFFSDRSLDCEVTVIADTRENFISRWRSIVHVLSAQEPKVLIFQDDPSLRYMAQFEDQSTPRKLGWPAWRSSISFYVPRGHPEDAAETEDPFTITTDPDNFVIDHSLEEGNVELVPVFQITAAADSSAPIVIENTDTGAAVNMYQPILNGEIMRFNGPERRVQKWNVGTSTWDPVSGGGHFPTLLPRAVNNIQVIGVTAGTLAVQYRHGYLGG